MVADRGVVRQSRPLRWRATARPADLDELRAAKRGRRISAVLPARNEGPTVGAIVAAIVALDPLVDEVVVVDDGSTDATAAEASGAGATVVAAGPSGPGKGHAMWRGLAHTGGDIVVFCDADLEAFDAGFVTGLVAPLLNDERLCFVKAAYRRSLAGRDGEGGRVNELVARPLLALLFPELAWIAQPLGGECAGRRVVLEQVAFVSGWGVDLALLVDIARRCGAGAIAQVDLGERHHRNRPLRELAPQAAEVLRTALSRASAVGVEPPGSCPPLGYDRTLSP